MGLGLALLCAGCDDAGDSDTAADGVLDEGDTGNAEATGDGDGDLGGDGDPTGDGDPGGDGDPADTGEPTCDGTSPYMGGWDIGCCQAEVVGNGWYPGGVIAGSVLPDWTFTDQYGDAVRVYDFCHKAIYFDYAAMWCGSCQAHAPELASLYNTYKDQGLMTMTFMSESADGGPTSQADVQAWASTYGQNGLVVYGTQQDVWFPFGVDQGGGSFGIALPGTALVGPMATIAKIGIPTVQEIELVIPGE